MINNDLSRALSKTTLNPAAWMHERLMKYIGEFESDLDNDYEVGASLVSFGQSMVFHIQNIGYHGPDIITFYGINEEGESIQLIQHISQLNVLFIKLEKIHEEPKRIGFQTAEPVT